MTTSPARWAIYIDIEGFTDINAKNPDRALQLSGALMEGIYKIGSTYCKTTERRLFVHQTGGDGFIIVSGYGAETLSLPVSISLVLMQVLLTNGGVAKSGIARGAFRDVKGCYPEIIRNSLTDGGVIPMGDGLMRIFPVMGDALVNAHTLTRKESGALLFIGSATDLPKGVAVTETCSDYACVEQPKLCNESAIRGHVAKGEGPKIDRPLRHQTLSRHLERHR